MSPRKKADGLPKRVKISSGAYFLIADIPGETYANGKPKQKWIKLCRVTEGEPAMLRALAALLGEHETANMPRRLKDWLITALPGLSPSEQKETERMANIIAKDFREFNADQIDPGHVHEFLHQNFVIDGKLRTAQRYRATLNKFFGWCQIKRYRTDNPCEPIRLKSPPKNDRYITDAEYLAIREALAIGADGKPTPSGQMMQCYMDLCYLTGQRSTDIRILKWSQIEGGVIHFKPTKTAGSSGAKVDKPIAGEIAATLERARNLGQVKSIYVIHTQDGAPYTKSGISSAWQRACKRAGITGATVKGLRAKHATDADKLGYSIEEIQTALAHEDTGTTRGYVKQRKIQTSKVELRLPK